MLDLVDLSTEECEALLRSGDVGRVALSTPDGPHIVPVNYLVMDQAIIVRTTPYSLLGTYGRDAVVAFEVDLVDHEHERGWSVIARGYASTVDDDEISSRVGAVRSSRTWATGSRSSLLQIRWTSLTGRRLGGDWDPLDEGSRRLPRTTGSE